MIKLENNVIIINDVRYDISNPYDFERSEDDKKLFIINYLNKKLDNLDDSVHYENDLADYAENVMLQDDELIFDVADSLDLTNESIYTGWLKELLELRK